MSLPIYQRVVQTITGAIDPSATYTVVDESTGLDTPVYTDRGGLTLKPEPYSVDSNGKIEFFIPAGITFRVAVTGATGSYTERYIQALHLTESTTDTESLRLLKVGDNVLRETDVGSASDEIPTNEIADSLRVKSVASVADLFGLVGLAGQQINISSYHPGWAVMSDGLPKGGGIFVWGDGVHDGGTVFDPNRTFPTPAQWAAWPEDPAVTAWFDTTGGTISGWLRENVKHLDVKYYGAIGNKIAEDYAPIQAAINQSISPRLNKAVYISTVPASGGYLLSKELTIPQNAAVGNAYGVKIFGDSSSWNGRSLLYGKHLGASILSLKGSNGSILDGITLESDAIAYPKTGLVCGRDAQVDSCGWHNIRKIWINGNFSVAGIYSIASEENIWADIFIQVQGGGAKYGFYSCISDALSVDSLPASSNIANSVSRLHVWNWQAIPDSACVYLETGRAMGSWSFNECYCIPKSGSYYRINMGAIDGLAPLGPFSFVDCGGEIYNPISPWLDTPNEVFRISSVANLNLVGLKILGGRGQLINAASTRKVLNVDPNITLIKPNIVIPPLEDTTISHTVFRAKIKGGIYDVADSSAWVPLAFSGAWGNTFGAPYAPAAFQVDATGTLRVRGSVSNGGAGVGTIATLPAGFEPPYDMFFVTQDAGVNAKILVTTAGLINLNVGTGNDVDLTCVAFKLVDA